MPTHRLSTSFHRKPLSHAILIACLSLGGTALSTPFSLAQAQTDSTALYNFNIAAGNLETALQQFAAQSGISLAYSPERVKGRQSAGVQGQHSSTSALQTLLAGSGLYASTQSNGSYRLELAQASLDSTALPTTVIYGGRLKPDEVGHNNVYNENVTSVYQGREELQRFQVTNPGDVFKGMNGVYSMDTRSSQAITPNIRGITGEGRVPLTIDGTEQSTNVWLHMFGAGNRSYVDPALFRSIEVEKGPSLSRGIKSGVGGAVNIRTIEADDIIPEGDSWGVELSVKASNNTSKPTYDPAGVYGQDYRTIPGAQRVGSDGVSLDTPDSRQRNKGNFNLDDHSELLTIAGRNTFADFLVSRSERTQGNYYAGKNNADKYTGHPHYARDTTDKFVPNLTKVYKPGSEVFNTSSETETTLLKGNLYLPHEQKVGMQFMRTDTSFGETTPGRSLLMYNYREAAEVHNPDIDWDNFRNFMYEDPNSELRIDRYKLSYDIKPKNSKWLNLESSLWHTKTDGTRHQTGISPWGINLSDSEKNDLALWEGWRNTYIGLFGEDWWAENSHLLPEPDHDGTIVPMGRQWTAHDRTGFDFNNLIQLNDRLDLTVGGSYQQEKLDEKVEQNPRRAVSFVPDGTTLHQGTDRQGPRTGERKEYSAMMNLSWQATDWLNLTAGTRYMHYKGKDTGTAKLRRERNEFYKATQRKTGMELQWGELLTHEENLARQEAIQNGTIPQFLAEHGDRELSYTNINGRRYVFWKKTAFIPYKDGKLDSSKNPFVNGEVDTSKLYEVVENALDQNGDPRENSVPVIYPTGSIFGSEVYESLDASQGWEAPEKQSGDAFSPVLSATARITPFGTVFARYAQTTRFPSVNELTSSAVIDGAGTQGILAEGAHKPERSTNWEIGYAHDLRQFFPGFHLADVRISYYDTTIENFMDRGYNFETIQFDEKKLSGLELQSRFDTGHYFGSLGITYRKKQKLCDEGYASGMDPFYNRIPKCMTGGFPGTYSGNSLQPKYSIDMLLGTRLFNDKLEMGWRSVYHKGAENKQLDRLLSQGSGSAGIAPNDLWFRDGNQEGFYWRSVLLHDIYANFYINDYAAINFGVTNLTDEYYLDPLSKTLLAGPGRTATAGLTINF